MKFHVKAVILIVSAVFLTALGSMSFAQTKTIIEPKAENFVFIVDNSGSMGFDYKAMDMDKSEAARDLLVAISQDLPDLDAGFGVYTHSPYKKYLPAGTPGNGGLEAAFNSIPVEFSIFGRQTPIGPGLKSLDEPLSRLQDRTDVIVVTDGEANVGANPVDVLREMNNKYGDNVCFHFISFAQSPEEKALVSQMSGIDSCSVTTEAHVLAQESGRKAFIQKIFYDSRQKAEAKPAPKPAAKPEPKPGPAVTIPAMEKVQFAFDSDEITPEYAEELQKGAEIMKNHPDKQVVINGYTCNIGPAAYNMKLSEKRAQAVAEFLQKQGVDADRLTVKAHGEAKPMYDNDTRKGRALNRMVQIKLK